MKRKCEGPWGDRIKVVEKPWGREEWIAYDNGRYAGKFLIIEPGERLSLQYHRIKHETLYVESGRVLFTLVGDSGQEETRELSPGEVVVVRPGTTHRMEAVELVRLIEFSSPELDDVVRLKDDYQREGSDQQ